MKKVKWTWDMGVYVPLCPYCNEIAYKKDHCVFCDKPFKWVDKSKERVVTVGDYTVIQTSSNHIYIYHGEQMVLHASCTKRESKRRLREMVEGLEALTEWERKSDEEESKKYV